MPRQKKFEKEILPDICSGKKTLAEGSRALERNDNFLHKNILLTRRQFKEGHYLFSMMSSDGRAKLQEYLDSDRGPEFQVARNAMSISRRDMLWGSESTSRGVQPSQQRGPLVQTDGPSNPGSPHVIDTPGVSFNDVYGAAGESEA
ncbi:MAG TPA: hypothetical protein VFP68_09530, partial [Burkholderiaceae bacterium]|nr:hypothetical protein [Burkholderiaceae bacterium]